MPRPTSGVRWTLLLLLFALRAPAPAAARELFWRAIEVRARLDDAGALHVVERQSIVFNGDWNGGERVFRVGPGQSLALESLSRIDPDGAAVPLSPGDLSAVDQYAWKDSRTLRWRSRLPSDPPFENREIVYEIRYRLSGILVREGSAYRLNHDFLFPDRSGRVERFDLSLELDPVWKPDPKLPETFSAKNLVPGEGFLVRASLGYAGSGHPSAGITGVSPRVRLALFTILAGTAIGMLLRFRRRDELLGRFAPLRDPDKIDAAWLDENLLSLAPEEAGALWDEKIGPPEVSAILARLAAQKKIETRAEGKKLVLKRLVPLAQFSSYDHELVKKLFFGASDETDTDRVRAHYRSSGFDPAGVIKPFFQQKLDALPDFGDKSDKPSMWPPALLFLLGLAAVILAAAAFHQIDPGNAVATVIGHLILWGVAAGCAYAYQRRVDRHLVLSPLFLWAPLLLLYLAWLGYRDPSPAVPWRVAGVFLMRLAIVITVFLLIQTRSGPKRIARRKALIAARRYFRRELGRTEPRLSDAWFPYVVAFGLTSDADRWFRAHGAASRSSSSGWSGGGSGSGSGSSSSSSPSSWTGGGGSFGGAGASASWAAAAGALSAGVASPSSGGSGGGGGGGGSSGGGGGGGW